MLHVISADTKFYKDLMEQDHRKTHQKHTFKNIIQCIVNFSKSLVTFHNSTVDPQSKIRIFYQYTSCVLVILLFWAISFMVRMTKAQIFAPFYFYLN